MAPSFRVAFFASCDDNYIPTTAAALLSFRRFFGDARHGYFIVGSHISNANADLLLKLNVTFVDVSNLCKVFETHRNARCTKYVKECFYIAAGPSVFYQNTEYDFCLSLDGDVFCQREFDLAGLCKPVRHVGMRGVGPLRRCFEDRAVRFKGECDHRAELIRLGFPEETVDSPQTLEYNTGVIIWNVRGLNRWWFELCERVFVGLDGAFESDQDLISMAAAHPSVDVHEFDECYNFNYSMDTYKANWKLWFDFYFRNRNVDGVYISHFIREKPWIRGNAIFPMQQHLVNQWRAHIRSLPHGLDCRWEEARADYEIKGSMLIQALMHALFMWHMVNHVVAIPNLKYTTPIFTYSVYILTLTKKLHSALFAFAPMLWYNCRIT